MKVMRDSKLCRACLVNMVTASLSVSVRVLFSRYKNAFLLYAFLFNTSEGKLH